MHAWSSLIHNPILSSFLAIMRPLFDSVRDQILSLLRQRRSIREVAEKCHVSKSTVQRIRSKHLSTLGQARRGRPAKLSVQDKRLCVRLITSGKLGTAVAVQKRLKDGLSVDVSERTVRRALQDAGMGAAEKESKPLLSAKNVKARLDFARRHKDWTVEDWKRVVWSDETKINRFCSDGRSWCWVRDGEGRQPRNVKQTVKHGGGSIMVWGCMTAEGVGFLCRIVDKMDQHLYKSILEDELLRTIEWYGLNPDKVVFQHDNDPKHKARSVQEWLSLQPFDVLEWPPQSPDLNPVEQLWAIVKRRLNEYERAPTGMTELWERVEEEWNKIDQETCVRLISSIPKRIQAVLKAKGLWTDY
jgi:transposase